MVLVRLSAAGRQGPVLLRDLPGRRGRPPLRLARQRQAGGERDPDRQGRRRRDDQATRRGGPRRPFPSPQRARGRGAGRDGLGAPSRKLREQALFWLGQSRGERGARFLGRVIDADPDEDIREKAIFSLSQSEAPGAADTIIRASREDRSPEVRGEALFWLAQMNDPRSPDAILQAIDRIRTWKSKRRASSPSPSSKRAAAFPSSSSSAGRRPARDPQGGALLARPVGRSGGAEVSGQGAERLVPPGPHPAPLRSLLHLTGRGTRRERTSLLPVCREGSGEESPSASSLLSRRWAGRVGEEGRGGEGRRRGSDRSRDSGSHTLRPMSTPRPVTPAESHPHPLELPADEMRALVEAALDRIVAAHRVAAAQPAADTDGAARARPLAGRADARDGDASPSCSTCSSTARCPSRFNTAGPGYLAYIPGGGLFQSAVADLIADAVNRYVGVFAAAPALVQLEANVVALVLRDRRLSARGARHPHQRRLARQPGPPSSPPGASGCRRTSSAAPSTPPTRPTTRSRRRRCSPASRRANVREVPSDERSASASTRSTRPSPTDRRARTRRPSWSSPTPAPRTPAPSIRSPSWPTSPRGEGLWLHVDARLRRLLPADARGRAAPSPASSAPTRSCSIRTRGSSSPTAPARSWSRDGEALRRAHSLAADYMPPIQDDPDLVDFCELSPELSRPFRGLRVWLPLKMHGIGAFREALEEKLELARWAADGAARRSRASRSSPSPSSRSSPSGSRPPAASEPRPRPPEPPPASNGSTPASGSS